MAQSKNGTPDSYKELEEAMEQARDWTLGLDEEKLKENLVILLTKVEHRAWDLGYNRGHQASGKKWWRAIFSGTIVVNNERLLNDPRNNPDSILLNKTNEETRISQG